MDADVPESTNLNFHLSGMIADHRRNLGRIRKIETFLILQICPGSPQTLKAILNFVSWQNVELLGKSKILHFSDI